MPQAVAYKAIRNNRSCAPEAPNNPWPGDSRDHANVASLDGVPGSVSSERPSCEELSEEGGVGGWCWGWWSTRPA